MILCDWIVSSILHDGRIKGAPTLCHQSPMPEHGFDGIGIQSSKVVNLRRLRYDYDNPKV